MASNKMCYDVKQNLLFDQYVAIGKMCCVSKIWWYAKCAAIWPKCGDRQNVLYEAKYDVWPKYGVRQNVLCDQYVVICKMCC